MTDKKYEYKILEIVPEAELAELNKELNALAQEGWRVVKMKTPTNLIVLEREVQQKGA